VLQPDTAKAGEEACTVNHQMQLTVTSMKYANMQVEI
jgi:hypothetical protein